MTEDVAPSRREEVAEVFDALDGLDGQLYMTGFAARVCLGLGEIFALLILIWGLTWVVSTALWAADGKISPIFLPGGGLYTLYSLFICARYVRRRNAHAAEGRRAYVCALKETGEVPQARALDRRFRTYAEWPVWVAHLVVLAFVTYGLLKYLQMI